MTEENQEWQAPPPPEGPNLAGENEVPQMSVIQTLTGMFFEPTEVFEDIRRKPFPRLLVPLFLCILLISAFNFSLAEKIGAERIAKEQLSMPIMEQVPEEAKKKILEDAKNTTVVKNVINNAVGGIFILVVFLIMGLLYWGAGLAFGGQGSFWQALAVASYSSFPVILVSMLVSILILFLKNVDDISFKEAQGGLLKLNPTLFLDTTPVLSGILSRIDVLVVWGMFLSVIGLQKCFKISSGSGWAIAVIIWLLGTAFVVMGKLFAG